jgi:hypothetical protein
MLSHNLAHRAHGELPVDGASLPVTRWSSNTVEATNQWTQEAWGFLRPLWVPKTSSGPSTWPLGDVTLQPRLSGALSFL